MILARDEAVAWFYAKMRNKEDVLENFLKELKMQYYSKQDLLEINNEFQNLKKEKMSVSEYTIDFTEKIKLVPYLVPTKFLK